MVYTGSDKGYEYAIVNDTTIFFNGQSGGYSACDQGKIEISRNKIKGVVAYCNKTEKKSRLSYFQVTNLGISSDTSSINIHFHFVKDTTNKEIISNGKFSASIDDSKLKNIAFKESVSLPTIEIRIPNSYEKLRLRLNINHYDIHFY
jgi:hypothetical protein